MRVVVLEFAVLKWVRLCLMMRLWCRDEERYISISSLRWLMMYFSHLSILSKMQCHDSLSCPNGSGWKLGQGDYASEWQITCPLRIDCATEYFGGIDLRCFSFLSK